MSRTLSPLRRAVMGVSDKEATAFSRGNSPAWAHLEVAVRAAVGGYHTVLDGSRFDELVPRLDRTPLELRGYAYEGAAMGLTGLDCFLPGKSRFRAFIQGPGEPHIYMAHIGAGEALARLRRKPEPFLTRLDDPVLRWLVLDGYGFHEGFFKTKRHVDEQRVPAHLSAFGRRVFDQGVGRSIWFTRGADPASMARAIAAFPADRHADLWLGVGVACGYVGGVDRATVRDVRKLAGENATQLAVGTAFVAKGRLRAGNPMPHTDLACDVLCGGSTGAGAASIVDDVWQDLPDSPNSPAYDALQQRIAARLISTAPPTDALTARGESTNGNQP
ncbi:DUF1702 family protein [Nocardia sp. NPDC051321]|uniref:DUF1702 family protein n=1 Tax=Nocardia sp. NPDC051321 TaxID=3364323 RepID=UPI0037989B16